MKLGIFKAIDKQFPESFWRWCDSLGGFYRYQGGTGALGRGLATHAYNTKSDGDGDVKQK